MANKTFPEYKHVFTNINTLEDVIKIFKYFQEECSADITYSPGCGSFRDETDIRTAANVYFENFNHDNKDIIYSVFNYKSNDVAHYMVFRSEPYFEDYYAIIEEAENKLTPFDLLSENNSDFWND